GHTSSVTATYNSSTLASITNPTKTGYTFAGWYTGSGGTGTLVINTSGVLQANVSNYTGAGGKWVGTEAKTLYAKWTEKTYSLTFSSTNGSIAVGGESVESGSTASVNHVTTKALVATPSDGYQFVNWTLSGSNTSAVTIGDANASSTTIKATATGATVTANFELIPASNHDISYTTASTGWSYGVKPTSAAEGDVVTFVVTPATGYTVSVTSSDVTLSGPNASNQYTFTMPDNNVSITVSATEKKRNVTISTSPTGAGSLNKTSASVGVTTTTTVTATAQLGYKFSSWTATNCNVASTTSASTTLSGDGGTGSATLVANFDRTYAFIEGRFHIMNEARTSSTNTFGSGDWDENSTRIPFGYDDANHQFVLSTHVTPKELTDKLGSCGDCKQYFFIKTSTASGSLTNPATYRPYTSGDSYQVFTTAGESYKKQTITPGNSEHSYRFNSSDESGYVKLYFNLSYIWYWLEQTLEYNANGGTGDAPAARTYYDRDQSIQAGVNAYTRDGYTFSGWNTQDDGLGTAVSENSWFTITSNTTLYAQWTPETYTITLDKQTSATGYGSSGTASVPSVTYNAVLPAISGTMPTATGSYGFMGFYTGTLGTGLRLTDASGTWIASVDGYTDADKKWIHAEDVTLYAYYKQAEISELTPDPAIIAPSETVTVTPTLSPAPAGTHIICWELQYNNGTPLPSQPTFTPGVGNAVSFPAPAASATYRIQATLRSGSSCGGGSVLSTRSETFQVAGDHTVTVQYKCGDMTIAESVELDEIKPLEWSENIVAPSITGYTFSGWVAGDGVTIKDGESSTVTTHIKATYDGTLTANYTRKRMIYFYNTLEWENVYVYFYKNSSYWEGTGDKRGSGANTTFTWTSTPYSEGKHGQMQPIADGANIYYFDAEAAGVDASYPTVVFTKDDQHNYDYFYNTQAVKRDDYASTTMPMFVPLADQIPDKHNGTDYYFNGYWMNYPENSGYTLNIYNWYEDLAPARTYTFPYSADLKMPLKLDVEFNNGEDFWISIYRNDGVTMGKNYEVKQDYNDPQTITETVDKLKVITSAPGTYSFTLSYTGTSYYIDVDYPAAVGDYRILYKDNATWAMGAHDGSWEIASDVINKNNGSEAKNDTVSFFISKGVGITASMKFQKITSINGTTGVVTWGDVAGGSITIPGSVTEAGVYNFVVSQPAGGSSISLEKVEPYTGDYYIRTDCAGNTKWNNYKTLDHQMTYSDYAAENSGFTHYYAHWVTTGTNVKFCIANDYSMCLTEHLSADYGTTIANINGDGNLLSGNANIRFMWNQNTNKISRAYISGSGNIAERFLVLEGDAKMYDENGNALTTAGGGKISGLEDNEMNLIDDENFVYERTIQVNTTARAKLTAKYNNNVQYFIGGASETVELLGGEESVTKYTMRIVYDFKTNRLVTAYMPSDAAITENLAIHADIMLIREHQNAGQQLTFDGGSLSDVKTVYGVMRFNRWTLNNKSTAAGHAPVGDPKSTYERSLYWISFPFDVNLSDVFGFGTYGTHWIIEYYDGAERATEGYWKDSEGFWKYITNRRGVTLEAGKGYILALDLDLMRDNNETFWANDIQQVELFFPSAAAVENIKGTDTEIDVPAHECTIAPRPGQTDDRRKKDSHWNIIGVPSYANYGSTLKNGSNETITWNEDPETKDLPFLYEWNTVDNTYSVQSGTTYPFKAMHAYMVQYSGKLKWTLASATPVGAPARVPSAAQNIEFRMELQQNSQAVDQTFLRMTNDEEISANFDFNYDLSKQMNSGKANIYTMVEGYIQTAGNCLPISEQTTVVPVGVKIVTNDDYTFSIPEGTDGVGVTLIDTETGIRTVLSAVDYTVSLEAGTYDNRFVLEISPIRNMPTELETSDNDAAIDSVRKLLIDGLLYIVRDGKVYDARGARVE
ncbi:MAG: InlB B-repeat-containing protein, partial [Paludibacteraceae bacterium]|nr:InlB B-repeat-containing protein [Paludibacteraceae bacterium]